MPRTRIFWSASVAESWPPLPWRSGLKGRDLLLVSHLSAAEVDFLLQLAARVKAHPLRYRDVLAGKSLAMLFEKPSLRTRITFELAMTQLGGRALYLGPDEVGLGKREAVKDVARNLSRWVDMILARVFSHESLVELSEHASVPVINGLSNAEHPCQALGDFLTLLEHKGRLAGVTLAWVGDGNNVLHSLLYAAARTGVRMQVATPPGYQPDPAVVTGVRLEAGHLLLTHDPAEAVAGADAVYTDVWTSMGQEAERVQRRVAFKDYQVNPQLMSLAHPNAILMHPLPAHHGEEVAEGVLEGTSSVVFDQAENRLHIQKAILAELLGP